MAPGSVSNTADRCKLSVVFVLEPHDAESSKLRDIVFGGVRVVDNHYMGVAEVGVGVKQAIIGSHRYSVGVRVPSSSRGIIFANLTGETIDVQAALRPRFFGHLINELSRRTEGDDTLAEFATAPFRDKQADERFATSGWELERHIGKIHTIAGVRT
jgi:hypothetical protein